MMAPCHNASLLLALISRPPCRQQLIAPGQVADCMYLISSGDLEILSPVGQVGPGGGPDAGPLISGLDLAQLQEQADPDVWDTTTVSDISKEPGGEWGERGGGAGFVDAFGVDAFGFGCG
jgi:hypothetical protein